MIRRTLEIHYDFTELHPGNWRAARDPEKVSIIPRLNKRDDSRAHTDHRKTRSPLSFFGPSLILL